MDWVPELGDDDLDVLMEALEAWESKDLFGNAMGDMLEDLLTRKVGPMEPEAVMQRRMQKERQEHDKRSRKERSVLLRAKLITLRDRRRAEHMVDGALRRNP